MKKLLALFLVLCMVFGFGAVATAETATETDQLRFQHIFWAMWHSEGEETNTFTLTDNYDVKFINETSMYEQAHSADEIPAPLADGTYTVPVKIWMGYVDLDTENFNNSTFNKLYHASAAQPRMTDDPTGVGYMYGMQPQQWRASVEFSTAIVITAEVDMFLDVYHLNFKNPGAGDEWTTNAEVTQYVADSEGTILKIRNGKVKETNDTKAYFDGVHLKAGDKCIVTLDGITHKPATTQSVPNFRIDVDGYDASKRTDFEKIRSLKTAKEEAGAELDDFVASLNKTDYTLANWSSIGDFVAEAKSAIKDMLSEEDIKAAVAEAKEGIDSVPTIAEQEAELKARRDEKKAELAAMYNAEHYTKKNWAKVQAVIDEAYAKIDAAKNVAAMKTAIVVAQTAIADIKVGGCGTTKQAEAGIVLGGLAAAIVVFTKKREN